MWPSCTGLGRASCMSQPGTINHFCFWPLHCSRIVPPSPSKWRLDPRMTSNGFKWGCAQAILSSSISGVELTTTKVSWLLLPLTCIPTSRGKASISFGSLTNSHLLCLVTWTVGSHLLPCCLGKALRSPLWRRAPLAGTGVRFQAFHGVPKHPSYWGYQKCPRTGGLSSHAPRKAEVVLWNPMYWQLTSQWTSSAP